jgi:hypothetical protein
VQDLVVRMPANNGDQTSTTVLVDCPSETASLSLRLCLAQLVWIQKAGIAETDAIDANQHNLELRVWLLDIQRCGASNRDCKPQHMSTLRVLPDAVTCALESSSGQCTPPSVVHTTAGALALAWAQQDRSVARVYAATTTSGLSKLQLSSGPTLTSVGRNPTLAFAATDAATGDGTDRGVLLLASADGFCQNNEAQNKAAKPPGLCGLAQARITRSGTPGVLVASYGELGAFEEKLRRGEVMSACDPLVMHGAYSLGTNPSVAIFQHHGPNEHSTRGMATALRINVASVHQGWHGADEGMCGLPLAKEGALVLAGWRAASLD